MISCGRARELLVENLRGAAGEMTLLTLDQHLQVCADCRRERARWETMGSLRHWQPPQLNASARQRIVKRLLEARPSPQVRQRSLARPLVLAGGLAMAVAVTLLFLPRGNSHFSEAGVVQLGDARVEYRAGTVARLDRRTIVLEQGELEITGRARLRTPRYLVRFSEAHAVFAAESIRVVSGAVYVYTLDERELTTLSAGQSWPPAPSVPAAPPPVAPIVAAPVRQIATPQPISAATALERARSSLAEGNAGEARRWIQRALFAHPSQHDRAEAELFAAESYLVEMNPARAVAQYRRVAEAYGQLPEGEAAAFARAQVLSETGAADESQKAFRAYLSRYPEGRFAREARDRLRD